MTRSWDTLAKQLGFPGELEMWKELYDKRKQSVSDLAGQLSSSSATVRSRIMAVGLQLRKQGGSQNSRFEVTEDVMKDVRSMGVRATALKLGVTPQALYSRLWYRYNLRKKDIDRMLGPNAAVPEETPGSASDQ